MFTPYFRLYAAAKSDEPVYWLENLYKTVPEKMVESLTIFGSADECYEKMKIFSNAGIDLPIVQFNPIGDVAESFKRTCSAFTGGDKS